MAPPTPQAAAAIRYLEFCVYKLNNSDRAIHNFLLSAYAKSSSPHDRSKLLQYLVSQSKVTELSPASLLERSL